MEPKRTITGGLAPIRLAASNQTQGRASALPFPFEQTVEEDTMTVAELILILQAMPQQAKVAVYESEPDEYLEAGRVTIARIGNKVNIISQYAVEAGYV